MSFRLVLSLLLLLTIVPAALAQGPPLPPEPDLAVLKTGPEQAPAGSNVTYSVTVVNGGEVKADNVTLTDPVPEGMTFVSGSQTGGALFACSYPPVGSGATITCTIAELAPSASATFSFVMNIPAQTPPGVFFTNTATATTTSTEGTDENNSSTVTTATPPPPQADLGVLKSGPDAAGPDTNVTYTFSLMNGGPAAAANVELTDTLPGTMTFVSLQQTGGPTLSCTTPAVGAGGTITCTAATFAAGAVATFTLITHVPADTASGTTYLNTVTATTTTLDPNEENNSASSSLTLSASDLSVVKAGPATAGETATYTITVTNAGPDIAVGAVLSDILPAGTTRNSFTQNSGPIGFCTVPAAGTNGAITCTWEKFGAAAEAVFTLVVNTGSSTAITNTATVSSETFDPNRNNNSSSVATTITQNADLVVSKSGPSAVTAGANVTYTITATNSGPSNAQTVTLTDVLPPNTTFVSMTQTGGVAFACSGTTTVTCTRATFNAGATATFALVVRVASSASGTVSNTATIGAATNDPDGSDNSATSVANVVTSADLAIVKNGPTAVAAGLNATYGITVTNNGPSDSANVTVSDTIPAQTTFVSFTQNSGPSFSCSGTTTVNCTIASFASGATATFTLVVQVSSSASGTVSNTATVSSSVTPDPVSSNNSSLTGANVGVAADVGVVKTGPTGVAAGTDATYTINVANTGPADAASVVLTDVLPAGTTFVSMTQTSGPSFACSGTASVTCSIGALINGATASFTLVIRVAPTNNGPVNNTATVTSTTGDPNGTNNSSTVSTPITPGATDLGVTKTVTPGPYLAGEDVTFTIVARNLGPANASNVVVTDALPAGSTFVSASSTQGTCSGTATVVCSVGSLAPAAQATITITISLPMLPGATTNTATVTSANADPNPTNNASSVQLDVVTSAQIPVLSPLMLALFALTLAGVALLFR